MSTTDKGTPPPPLPYDKELDRVEVAGADEGNPRPSYLPISKNMLRYKEQFSKLQMVDVCGLSKASGGRFCTANKICGETIIVSDKLL